MDLVEAEKAKKDFEELLSAYWTAQLALLRAQPDSDDPSARGEDSREMQGAENE